jgi:hypothetical protein
MPKESDEVIDLSVVRASKSSDALDWTPVLALKKVVSEIEAGEINPDMVFICMRQMDGDDMAIYDSSCAGVDRIKAVGLLTTHIHQILNGECDIEETS